MDFNSLLPLIIGLSVWIYGTVLLVNKIQSGLFDKKKIQEKT